LLFTYISRDCRWCCYRRSTASTAFGEGGSSAAEVRTAAEMTTVNKLLQTSKQYKEQIKVKHGSLLLILL
jgi:hypothetical protein